MPPTDPEPRTEAGRRLYEADLHDFDDVPLTREWKARAILAIETEAANAAPPTDPTAALRTALTPLKWWVLADIAHERNESIADVGGHCNHDESPPECIREGQSTADAYNAAWASQADDPSGPEPGRFRFGLDDPSGPDQ